MIGTDVTASEKSIAIDMLHKAPFKCCVRPALDSIFEYAIPSGAPICCTNVIYVV